MGRKKKRQKAVIFCYYCDRVFDDEAVLIQHQRAKHFKCPECFKKISSAHGMMEHCYQVHKESLDKVPNAKPGRDSFEIDIFGMGGVPPEIIAEKRSKIYGEPAPKKQAQGGMPMASGPLVIPGTPSGMTAAAMPVMGIPGLPFNPMMMGRMGIPGRMGMGAMVPGRPMMLPGMPMGLQPQVPRPVQIPPMPKAGGAPATIPTAPATGPGPRGTGAPPPQQFMRQPGGPPGGQPPQGPPGGQPGGPPPNQQQPPAAQPMAQGAPPQQQPPTQPAMNPARAQRMGMPPNQGPPGGPGGMGDGRGGPPPQGRPGPHQFRSTTQTVSGAPPSRSQREREKLTGMVAPGHPSYRAPPPAQQPPPANGQYGRQQPPTPDQSQHPGYRQGPPQGYGQPVPQQPQHALGRPYGAVPQRREMQPPPAMQQPVVPNPQQPVWNGGDAQPATQDRRSKKVIRLWEDEMVSQEERRAMCAKYGAFAGSGAVGALQNSIDARLAAMA